ncbi:MAG: hypothetical protein ABSB90_07480 [Thermoplasmata archaeon]
MTELPRPTPTSQPPRPPGAPVARPVARFAEPPALRVRPDTGRVCVNCSTPVGARSAPPLCWGCGRTLCADCYWRHGLTPAAHRCAGCAARGMGRSTAISGGRSATDAPSLLRPSVPR